MEKENTVFTELNNCLVKHYYRDKSESFFQVNGVEFVLMINHYCNVLTIETIKLVFKPLDMLRLFRITRKSQCVVPENIQTFTTEGIGNSRGGGGGGSEAQEIPGGRGVGQ